MDHLPLWVALGAVASTGIYEPEELAVMALPLAAGAAVEALRRDLGPYRRWLEIGALLFFLADLARGRGVFPVAIHTLYLLLEDMLFLKSGTPDLLRNTDVTAELKRLAQAVDFDWIAAASQRLGEVESGMRRNLLRSLSLDAFAAAVEP